MLDKRRIAFDYLTGLFTFDFLTNVPFVVGLIMNLSVQRLEFHILKTLTLLRIVRLPTVVRYCQRSLLRLGVDEVISEVVKLLFFWIICIHWAACLHIIPGVIMARFRDDVKVNAWYEKRVFQRHDPPGRYVICLFKAIKTFMGGGYVKDLQPSKHFDRIYSSLLTIAGRVGLCVTLAYVFKIIQGMRSSSLRYAELMVQVETYTNRNGVPPTTKAKLKRNYDYKFRKLYFNEREILANVSPSLRQQILVHNTRQLVANSSFFDNLPQFLVLQITSALRSVLYLEGDVVYTVGEVGMSAFFVESGSVAFYSPSGREVCHFSDGDYFGETTLVSEADRHYAKVVALETTKCYK